MEKNITVEGGQRYEEKDNDGKYWMCINFPCGRYDMVLGW